MARRAELFPREDGIVPMSVIPQPSDLFTALRDGGLSIAYQPQRNLDDAWRGALVATPPVAVEALSRWSDPTCGDVSPEDFIPLAEQGRFLGALDIDVLGRAAAQVASWHRAGESVALAVNVAPSHFSMAYAESAVRIVESAGLDPAALTLEITETPPPQFDDAMRTGLEFLRTAGIAVSVDDFGAGDTALDVLKTVPIDEVKLDRSLVQNGDDRTEEIVARVVAAAQDHGWRVVAEGIETVDDLERAVRRGCHRGQGFLWGRPMTASAMASTLG